MPKASTKLKRDKITSYRLSEKVVQEYLESLFGPYDFQLHHKSDHWIFYIPRKLTVVEFEELDGKREQQE
ncbi:uncharacterized protein K444DRAFT_615719 [Hyaloscypha bicolor E]|uniref:Uncharacterized protein n=1 Tax=Hyaloscypha bicolor E TaxID=1095630 RepID=A0A2J6T2L4_9HELO|nr:uncharacterized protein K444DRAFT_615719 [Hyaloscypha bicolor E]PMD57265.1 hypothetical protein K444DRAFT_615719 [Hyaloscypha bicolor E]